MDIIAPIHSIFYLCQGAVIGLCIAIPVGPIAFLCMQYALQRGFTIACSAAIGAALADACFGLIACLGLSLLTDWLILNSCWLQLSGGLLLCYLGSQLCWAKVHPTLFIDVGVTRWTAFGSTFALTLANPLTILAFMALFGYFGMANLTHQPQAAVATVIGIFAGSLSWWLLLTYGTAQLRPYFNATTLLRFRQIGGALLLLFGVITIARCGLIL